jgi:hypothetical protein
VSRGAGQHEAEAHEGDPDASAAEGGLTAKQEAALTALLNHPTIKRAAEACGVPERTIYRWLDECPAFARAYRRARRQAFGHAISLAQQGAAMAVGTLIRLLNDPACGNSAKVAAATNLLRFGREGIELDELVERIEALEAAGREQQQDETEGASWRH